MAEDAERCLISRKKGTEVSLSIDPGRKVKTAELDVAPAGSNSMHDYRLRLAHIGSWMDQFLLMAKTNYIRWPSMLGPAEQEAEELRRRSDIWTALGLVKEMASDAYSARAKQVTYKDEADGRSARRYLAHIEARCLQAALTMLLIFLAFKIAPYVLRLWGFSLRHGADRLLVFRDWQTWWRRYVDLRQEYQFSMRMAELIDTVCAALRDVENLGSDETAERESERKSILVRVKAQLEQFGRDENKAATFMNAVASSI